MLSGPQPKPNRSPTKGVDWERRSDVVSEPANFQKKSPRTIQSPRRRVVARSLAAGVVNISFIPYAPFYLGKCPFLFLYMPLKSIFSLIKVAGALPLCHPKALNSSSVIYALFCSCQSAPLNLFARFFRAYRNMVRIA